MKNWRKYLKAAIGTVGLISVWIAAVACHQPAVEPPPLPLLCIGINHWIVTNDCTTAVTVSGTTHRVTIREGFRTDLASIAPVFAKPLGITHDSPTIRRGALIHDALYASHLTDRATADAILYAACLQDGMEPDKAAAVYQAVHLWGWQPWGNMSDAHIAMVRRQVTVER